MSDLTRFGDHARRMSAANVPEADRVLWARLADEVDAYLARDPDVIQHALPVIDDDQLNLLETP